MSSQAGCAECRLKNGEKAWPTALEVIHEDVRGTGLERVGFYQTDRVHRCSACGTYGLFQFWEWDDERTRYKEWGHTEAFFYFISADEWRRLNAAIQTETPLPHSTFRDGRPMFQTSSARWTAADG